jgi:hypothetical protein
VALVLANMTALPRTQGKMLLPAVRAVEQTTLRTPQVRLERQGKETLEATGVVVEMPLLAAAVRERLVPTAEQTSLVGMVVQVIQPS